MKGTTGNNTERYKQRILQSCLFHLGVGILLFSVVFEDSYITFIYSIVTCIKLSQHFKSTNTP